MFKLGVAAVDFIGMQWVDIPGSTDKQGYISFGQGSGERNFSPHRGSSDQAFRENGSVHKGKELPMLRMSGRPVQINIGCITDILNLRRSLAMISIGEIINEETVLCKLSQVSTFRDRWIILPISNKHISPLYGR
jgi:hypothetical protein